MVWGTSRFPPVEEPLGGGCMRRFKTMFEIFSELNRAGGGTGEVPPEREPVLLLLGGGMAAGKSTVREIIGHDDFWSKV